MTCPKGIERLRRAAIAGRAEGIEERERIRALYGFQPDPPGEAVGGMVELRTESSPAPLGATEEEMMVDVYVGQTGTVVVHMVDDQGRETTRYDEMTGISYTVEGANAVEVVDTDANPFDAELSFTRAHAEGESDKVVCEFDGAPGEPERHIRLESDMITVLEPPPGEAVGGSVEIVLHQV